MRVKVDWCSGVNRFERQTWKVYSCEISQKTSKMFREHWEMWKNQTKDSEGFLREQRDAER